MEIDLDQFVPLPATMTKVGFQFQAIIRDIYVPKNQNGLDLHGLLIVCVSAWDSHVLLNFFL